MIPRFHIDKKGIGEKGLRKKGNASLLNRRGSMGEEKNSLPVGDQ